MKEVCDSIKRKMNSMENRKIKRFIVWVRHTFIILIGSILCQVCASVSVTDAACCVACHAE